MKITADLFWLLTELHKNYISSNTALKLIAQTQVDKETNLQTLTPTMVNIDLSEQKEWVYAPLQIELLEKIITKSGLKILDLMGVYTYLNLKDRPNLKNLETLKESLSSKIIDLEKNGFIIFC